MADSDGEFVTMLAYPDGDARHRDDVAGLAYRRADEGVEFPTASGLPGAVA